MYREFLLLQVGKRGGYYLLSFKAGVTTSSTVAEGVMEATMLIYWSLTGKLRYPAAVLVQAGHGALKPGGVQEFAGQGQLARLCLVVGGWIHSACSDRHVQELLSSKFLVIMSSRHAFAEKGA